MLGCGLRAWNRSELLGHFGRGRQTIGPQEKNGHLVGPGDFAAQFKQTWDNAQRLLLSAGALPRNIATITVYTTDAKWQEGFTALLHERLSDWNPVTSFAVAPQLRTPGARLEIQTVALIEKRNPIRR